ELQVAEPGGGTEFQHSTAANGGQRTCTSPAQVYPNWRSFCYRSWHDVLQETESEVERNVIVDNFYARLVNQVVPVDQTAAGVEEGAEGVMKRHQDHSSTLQERQDRPLPASLSVASVKDVYLS
ncbi:unnamed protein product, partial [Amoebophrya sp. A120]